MSFTELYKQIQQQNSSGSVQSAKGASVTTGALKPTVSTGGSFQRLYEQIRQRNNPTVDDAFIRRYLSDTQNFLNRSGTTRNWQSGRTAYDDSDDAYEDLLIRTDAIKRYLKDNNISGDLASAVDEASRAILGNRVNLRKLQDYYGQWDDQAAFDDYQKQLGWYEKYQGKKYSDLSSILSGMEDGEEKEWLSGYAYHTDQEEKKKLDLDAYSRELEALEKQLADYAPEFDWTDNQQRDAVDAEIQRMQDEINRRKMYLADAKKQQEKARYESYRGEPDFMQRAQSGLKAFEDSKLKDREEESWFEVIGRYLGKTSDTTMALGDTGRMAQEYRKDTTYKEPADNWTQDEQNMFGYLYSIDPEAAADYAVKTSEDRRRAENQQKIGAVQEWATKNGVNASAGTVAAIAMMPLSLADTLNALTEYNARGTISTPAAPTPGQVSEAITGAVGQSLNEKHGTISEKIPVIGGKGWGDAYQLSTSIANSLLSAYTQGSVGTDILFFGSAASSTMTNAKDRGATDEQAIKLGILSGLAEAAGEHFSIEGLIGMSEANTMKAFFGNVLKQSGIEASEEGFTTLMNNFADQLIMGKDSTFYEKVRVYMSEKGMTMQEAKKQVWKDMAEDLAFDMVGGAISGGVSTGIQTGAQKMFAGTHQAQTHHEPLATELAKNATEHTDNATPALENTTRALEKSTPGGVTEESSAVDDKLSATESTVGKIPGKDESSTVRVGVSKMETVQQTADIESFAQQFGTQAEAVKRNYMEGQDLQEYEVGFEAAYTMGRDGGKAESLNNSTLPGLKYLSQSQRDIAFSLGRDAAAAQKASETKVAAAKAPTTKASLGQTAQLVAEDGSNGGTVTIAEIVSMDNSGMTFRLEDGRTVTDEDLDFPEGAEVYSTVIELGMDAESANAIVKASAVATIPRAAVAEGIETAYHYGRYGYGMDALLKARETAGMPESILQASYQAGEKRRQQRRETAQTEGNRAASKATAPERRGKVHFYGESDTLNDVQKESLRGLEWIADLTGAQIYVEDMGNSEGLARVNGLYDPADDSIHIDLRAGSDGTGTLLYTAAHEFVHRMRQNNEATFYRLADFLVEQYGRKGISTDALVKQQMADAAADGVELNYDEAFEEMVADAMEAMFTDTDALTKMEKLKTQDKSLWQEIKDFVLGLAEKIKAAYARLKPDSAEARYVLQMKESIDQFAQLFAEGVMENGAEKNTARKDGEKIRYSVRSSFAKELQEWFDTTSHDERKVSGRRFLVGTTTDVLKSIGVKDYEIYFGGSKIDKILTGNTSMTLDTIKQAVQLLEDPILIMQSRTVEDSIVLFGEVYTDGDKPVMISVLLNPKTRSGEILDYAVITSAYGRRKGNVQNLIDNSTIYYVNENKERTEKWLQALGLQLPSAITKFGSISSISGSKAEVNQKFSRRKQSETEALQEQNAKLQEDVERLKELVKLQGQVTNGKILKPSSVENAAKYLKKLFHAGGNTKELAEKLNEFYGYLLDAPEMDDFGEHKATAPELILESVKEQAAPIVDWLQEHEKFQRNQYAQEILDTLKGQSFYLDETQMGEAKSQYGSMANYRMAVKNMVTGKSTQSLDQLWQELSGQYPDIFSPDTNSSDMPLTFAEALDRLENMEDTETAADWMMKDQTMLEEILDSFWRVDRLETVADRYKKQINELRWKHELQMKQLRRDRDSVLANLRADKNLSMKTVRNNRDRAELRRKIQKHAKAMSQKLLKPSDNAHVPEELKHTVAQVLNAINMESQYTLDPETGKRKKAPDGLPVERTKAFLKLQQQCSAIIESGGSIIIDPEMADQLADVLEWSDTPLTDMTKEQLTTVWKVIRSVEHSISTAGKMLSKARWESVDGFAGALEQTAQSRGKRKQLTDQNIGLDMETPITFFSHFGEAGEEMFRMLRDAQDKEQVLQDLMGAEARKLATAKQIEQLESQVHQFTVDGQTIYLNTAQIMELYVLTKQEDARSHLLSENNGKGIVQPNVEGQLDAGGKKKKVKVREGEQVVRMNARELGTIIGSLSKEQRALADGIQKLTDLLAAEGNKASMQVYGYQKFTGKDYWPIRSSSLQLKEGMDKRLTPKRSVKNMSSAKNRQENAKNALTVPGIFDTFSRHCKEMTEYAAYLAVMEDLDRLYNYQYSEKTTNEQGEEVWKLTNKAAKGYLKQLAGTGADRYWMNLMEDLQNGIGSNSVWGYGTVGKAKAAAVSGNIRVILQQFTAFPRAAVCMKTSDLLYGMTHSKGAWKRALQHSPTAMRKDAGTFDIGNAKQMKELLFDIHSGLDKANDALAKGAGWADAVTWGWLWRAAEHQVARTHKHLEIGTDGYWQEVNRVFTQTIDETQVVDGILQRSQYMRNPDALSKSQTSFMGEPTMALNLLLRSYDNWAYETDGEKRKAASKKLGMATAGVVMANSLAAVMQSVVDAWRDDDEDKTYWERFWKAFTGYDPEAETTQEAVKGVLLDGNWTGSLNPLGWIPLVKDGLSMLQGYDVIRADADVLKGLMQAAQTTTDAITGDSSKTRLHAIMELGNQAGKVFAGSGAGNVLRDVYGITHSVLVEAQNAAGLYTVNALVYEPTSDKNKSRYMDLLHRAIGWGDTGGYDYVRQQLIEEGYLDSDIREAMKDRIKDDYKEGNIDRETAYDRLVKYTIDPEADAKEAENDIWFQLEAIDGKAAYKAENGDTEGYNYSRYENVYAAVRGKGNFQEAVKELTDHGYEKDTVIGEVKSQIGQWQRSGEITEMESQKMLTAYCDMETEDAKARVKAWAWMKRNPKSQATVDQVEAYQRPLEGLNRSIADMGIGMETYLKEKKAVAAFESDEDEYGKSIDNSRINKAFPYINRLNLTRDQKTALAVACGWSYKTVTKNKLW